MNKILTPLVQCILPPCTMVLRMWNHLHIFSLTPNLIFFCDLKPHAKFQNPTITPSGREVSEAERKKKKEKKTPLIVDT